ncbi:MAG TPA: adenylate/guanylate cyclase domain-containing protein [Elusimicrobia bacterium]|nr:adenylate/guanylate cyclase domain-containing protein [Elusimicrobiota bacterium]
MFLKMRGSPATGEHQSSIMRSRRHILALGAIMAALACAIFWARHTDLYALMELKTLDWRFRSFSDPARADRSIVLAMLDQQSLDHFEEEGMPWPWPRSMYAAVLDFLSAAGARAVVFDILFTSASPYGAGEDAEFAGAVKRAVARGVKVLFASEFSPRPQRGARPVPARFEVQNQGLRAFAAAKSSARPPIPELLAFASAIGDAVADPDLDGVHRRIPLAAELNGRVYPSLPVAIAQAVLPASSPAALPLDDGRLLVRFHGSALSTRPPGGRRTYPSYPLGNLVLARQSQLDKSKPALDPSEFKDKIVLIGYTAAGLMDNRPSPIAPVFPGTEILAAAADNILHGDPLRRAPDGWAFAAIAFAALAGALAAFLASGSTATSAAFLLAALLPGALSILLFKRGIWLDFVGPQISLVLGFTIASVYSYMVEGRQRRFLQGALSVYLSKQVVREIVEHPEKLVLGGDRRELSVFFSDIQGFTTISEMLDPKALTKLMNRYLGEMTDVILELDGTLDKYIGDAIMAFWNAPLDQKDHAVRACRAALANQQRLVAMRRDLEKEGLPQVYTRIGLNSGPASVGNMGSLKRFSYTAISDAVNLSSRLEGLNKYYGTYVMLSGSTRALAAQAIEARELDLIKVKGKHKAVAVYELLGLHGETPRELLELAGVFGRGLECYRARDFDAAERFLSEALRLRPDDGPSRVLLGRITEFRKSPPPQDWDGSYEMHEK